MNGVEWIVLILASIGTAFMLISAIGVIRLPDVYARMHAAGKAATLGVSCLLIAAGFFYGADLLVRMIILVLLFFYHGPDCHSGHGPCCLSSLQCGREICPSIR